MDPFDRSDEEREFLNKLYLENKARNRAGKPLIPINGSRDAITVRLRNFVAERNKQRAAKGLPPIKYKPLTKPEAQHLAQNGKFPPAPNQTPSKDFIVRGLDYYKKQGVGKTLSEFKDLAGKELVKGSEAVAREVGQAARHPIRTALKVAKTKQDIEKSLAKGAASSLVYTAAKHIDDIKDLGPLPKMVESLSGTYLSKERKTKAEKREAVSRALAKKTTGADVPIDIIEQAPYALPEVMPFVAAHSLNKARKGIAKKGFTRYVQEEPTEILKAGVDTLFAAHGAGRLAGHAGQVAEAAAGAAGSAAGRAAARRAISGVSPEAEGAGVNLLRNAERQPYQATPEVRKIVNRRLNAKPVPGEIVRQKGGEEIGRLVKKTKGTYHIEPTVQPKGPVKITYKVKPEAVEPVRNIRPVTPRKTAQPRVDPQAPSVQVPEEVAPPVNVAPMPEPQPVAVPDRREAALQSLSSKLQKIQAEGAEADANLARIAAEKKASLDLRSEKGAITPRPEIDTDLIKNLYRSIRGRIARNPIPERFAAEFDKAIANHPEIANHPHLDTIRQEFYDTIQKDVATPGRALKEEGVDENGRPIVSAPWVHHSDQPLTEGIDPSFQAGLHNRSEKEQVMKRRAQEARGEVPSGGGTAFLGLEENDPEFFGAGSYDPTQDAGGEIAKKPFVHRGNFKGPVYDLEVDPDGIRQEMAQAGIQGPANQNMFIEKRLRELGYKALVHPGFADKNVLAVFDKQVPDEIINQHTGEVIKGPGAGAPRQWEAPPAEPMPEPPADDMWKQPFSQLVRTSPIPEQQRLPDSGHWSAVKMNDGSIHVGRDTGDFHLNIIKQNNLPMERVRTGGYLHNGDWAEHAKERNDALLAGQQARARLQKEHRASVEAAHANGLPVPEENLDAYGLTRPEKPPASLDFDDIVASADFEQDPNIVAAKGPTPNHQPGSEMDIIQKSIEAGETPAEIQAKLKLGGFAVPDLDLITEMTRSGAGYRDWYPEEAKTLTKMIPDDILNDPDKGDVRMSLFKEITTVFSVTSAGVGPLQNALKTINTMISVRRVQRAGGWDPNDFLGTARRVWEENQKFPDGNGRDSMDGIKAVVRAYMDGLSPTKIVAMKTPTYGAQLFAGIFRRVAPGNTLDLQEGRVFGALKVKNSFSEKQFTAVQGFAEEVSRRLGFAGDQAQAARWEVMRIIGGDTARATADITLPDGTVILKGDLVTVVKRNKDGSPGQISHPLSAHKTGITKKLANNLEVISEGSNHLQANGMDFDTAIRQAFNNAKEAGLFDPDAMRARLRRQLDAQHKAVEPYLGELQDLINENPTPGSPEMERAFTLSKRGQNVTRADMERREAEIKAKSPIIRVALTRGEHPTVGTALKQFLERLGDHLDPETMQIDILNQAGIRHEVVGIAEGGQWNDNFDKSLDIVIIGGNAKSAAAAGDILGQYFGNQDAVAIHFPDAKIANAAGYTFRHPNKMPFNPAEQERLTRIFKANGIGDLDFFDNGMQARVNYFGPDAAGDPNIWNAKVNRAFDQLAKMGQPVEPKALGRFSVLSGPGMEEYGGLGVDTANAGLQDIGIPGREALPNAYPEATPGVAPDVDPATIGYPTRGPEATGGDPDGWMSGPQGPFADLDWENMTPQEVRRARYERLKANGLKLGGNLGSNLGGFFSDPQVLKEVAEDVREIGLSYIHDGVRTFEEFSRKVYGDIKALNAQLADAILPELRMFWDEALKKAERESTDPAKRSEFASLRQGVKDIPADLGTESLDEPGAVLAKLNLDPYGEAAVRQKMSEMDIDKLRGYVPLDDQRAMARQLADRLRINQAGDDELLLNPDASKLSGVEINALQNVVNDNVAMIEKYSRLVASQDLRVGEETRQQAMEVLASLDAQNDALLSKIITARSQKGRDLGSLRLLAARTNEPAVWLAKAKQALGDRPLTDAVRNRILALSQEIKDVC